MNGFALIAPLGQTRGRLCLRWRSGSPGMTRGGPEKVKKLVAPALAGVLGP